MCFGQKLRYLRKSRNLTLMKLSELSRVSQPFLSQMETEQRECSIETIKKLSAAFGMTVIEFMAETGLIDRTEIYVRNSKSINDLVQQAHQNAIEKGWYEEPRTFGELIALMHSELSEALEDHRNGRDFREIYYEGDKPCGIPIELADVCIRIFDACGHLGIDLEAAIREKMAYNATRPRRHGGKRL